jgi:hypothetical protein
MERHFRQSSSEPDKVISPFAENEVTITRNKGSRGKIAWVVSAGLLLVLVGALLTFFATRYLNDPYRTLEAFPVAKYFEGYEALAGSKYRADFRVEADLGWKDGVGRLMLFSTADDSRPFAVMIPLSVANGVYFTKGQTYTAEIEVKEGGLIYADSFQKN